MQRRFEFYRFLPEVPQAKIDELGEIFRNIGRFIHQVKDSIVATNLADSEVTMIWEHAYDSPESYEEYMRHPYHACILDRYLMHGCPERITARTTNLTGLVGYDIADRGYFREKGLRRVLLLGVRDDASPQQGTALEAALREAPSDAPSMKLSVIEPNSMGNAWRKTPWSHVWEQTFDDEKGLRAYLDGDSAIAAAERDWSAYEEGLVTRTYEVRYELHTPV